MVVLKLSEERFALMLSISHTLVDGYTYYSIYGMLSSSGAPKAMVSTREPDFMPQALLRTKENNEFFVSCGFICNILGHIFCSTKPVIHHRYVSADHIAKVKQQQKETDGCVISTNDIITSSFFVNSNCDVGFAAVNFRGRIASATAAHAGNYEGTVSYHRADFETPRLIRESIGSPVVNGKQDGFDIKTSFRRVKTNGSPLLPGFFPRKKARIAIITNWCSFFVPVVLDGCEQELHIPILEVGIPTGLAIIIMYMATPTKMALALFEPANNSMVHNMTSSGLISGTSI